MSFKTKNYNVDQIEKIEVTCKIFKIRVVESPSDQIELSWSDTVMRTLEIKEKAPVISIMDHASIGIYGTLALIDLKKDAQLLIKIPKYYYGKLILQTKGETIHISDLSFQGNLGISTNTGAILLENSDAHIIDIRANTGKTECYGIDASESIFISSTRGDIICNLQGNKISYTISCTGKNRRNISSGSLGNGSKSVQLLSEFGQIQYACLNGKASRKPRNRYNRYNSFKEW